MVQLVSVIRIDEPENLSTGSQSPVKSYVTEEQRMGVCTVQIERPSEFDHFHPNKETLDVKNSPSTGNFYSKSTPINVQWKNISLATKKGTLILKQLSGAVHSGELTAIMGPSGAGKTSLLNALSGFTRNRVTGQILVNGVNREMRVFRKLTSYILQDDHILPRLTVREIVSIAASLKIPSTVPKQERRNVVDKCLQCLGLESQENQKGDELSGGQRKRLCIAQELVSNPPLILLDEPTSGLDSSSCLQCIQLLKSLAKEGRTVVCTVHQPSSKIYEMFDNLYMLAEGYCIYRGSIQNLVPFLSGQGLACPQYHNPADYVTEVAIGGYGDWNWRLKNAINEAEGVRENSSRADIRGLESTQELKLQASTISLLHRKSIDKPPDRQDKLDKTHNGYATSSFNQFRVLFYRNVLCTIREPTNIQLKFFGSIVFSLLLGVMYFGIGNDASKVYNNTILLFCTITFTVVCAEIPTVLTFPMKRTIFDREQMNSWYSTRMYYFATTAAEVPFQLSYPIISGSIIYWMTDQPSDMFRFGFFLLSLILITLVSESIGQLIGAGFNVQNGIFIASVAAIHILLFCGFFITINEIPVYLQWISHTSFGRYAFQSVLLTFYTMDRPPLYCNKTACPYEDPAVILKDLEMEGELYVDYAALLGYFILFRIVTYLILKLTVKRMH